MKPNFALQGGQKFINISKARDLEDAIGMFSSPNKSLYQDAKEGNVVLIDDHGNLHENNELFTQSIIQSYEGKHNLHTMILKKTVQNISARILSLMVRDEKEVIILDDAGNEWHPDRAEEYIKGENDVLLSQNLWDWFFYSKRDFEKFYPSYKMEAEMSAKSRRELDEYYEANKDRLPASTFPIKTKVDVYAKVMDIRINELGDPELFDEEGNIWNWFAGVAFIFSNRMKHLKMSHILSEIASSEEWNIYKIKAHLENYNPKNNLV